MRAFLERCEKEWLDDFVYISRQPLLDRGFEIVPFDGNNLKSLFNFNLNIKTDMIVGSVEATVEFFKLIDVKVPKYIGYPESLREYLGRNIQEVKVSSLINEKLPYFIKPAEDVKKFTGCLIEKTGSLDFLKKYDNLKDDDVVLLSEPIDIISEYRCFVHKQELKGIQYYSGDYRDYPNVNMIEAMISDYVECNCAYTLDVGVLSNGSTILIEVNDMWAIGSYGFDSKKYVSMIVERFFEITRNNQ